MTDWEFVFDGVVGFLRSPMWNVPIVTFIERHCVVFEPSDENELAYTEIHKEYGDLVEELLTSYLKDVGITEDQFVSACEAGSRDNAKVPDRSIFEQVWAGEDFDLFKKIMVKKNLDLELQALHMIQQRNGVVPKVFASENEKRSKTKSKQKCQTDEETLLVEVMEQSRQEFEKEKGKRKEIERMEKTLALSKEESERLHELAERELNELERMVTLSLRLEHAREKDGTSKVEKKTKESSESKTSSQKNKGKPAEVKSAGKPSAKETPKPSAKETPKPSAKETPKPSAKETPKPATTKPATTTKSSSQPGAVQAKPSSTKQKRDGSSSPKPKPVAETVTKKESKNAVSTQANPRSSPKHARQPEAKLPPVKTQRTPAEAAADWILSAKAEVNTSSESNSLTDSKNGEPKTPIEDEIMQRANYMRIQREKLLNLKKQERTKRLRTFAEEQTVKRPMSSLVAQRVTEGNEAGKPATSAGVQVKGQKKSLMSRALAERLKEVINESNLENK